MSMHFVAMSNSEIVDVLDTGEFELSIEDKPDNGGSPPETVMNVRLRSGERAQIMWSLLERTVSIKVFAATGKHTVDIERQGATRLTASRVLDRIPQLKVEFEAGELSGRTIIEFLPSIDIDDVMVFS